MSSIRSILHVACLLVLSLAGVSGLLLPKAAQADPSGAFTKQHEDFLKLLFWDESDFTFQYQRKPSYRRNSGTTDIERNSFSTELDVGIPLSEDDVGFADIEYDAFAYNFNHPPGVVDSFESKTINRFVVGTGLAEFVTPDFLLAGVLYPGIYSDLDGGLSTKDLQIQTGPIAVYRLNPNLSFHAGVLISQTYFNQSVYPLLGLSWWSEDRAARVNITLPVLARAGYWVTPTNELYLIGWNNDNDYHVRFGADEISSHVRLSDIQLGAGTVWWWNKNWNVSGEVGMTLFNDFAVKNGAADQTVNVDSPAVYFQLTFGVKLA